MTACCQVSTSLVGQEDFERVLAAEGLAPLDTPGGLVSNLGNAVGSHRSRAPARRLASMAPQSFRERADAAKWFLEWAHDVLNTFEFTDERHRQTWALYADGKPLSEIGRALGIDHRSVTRAISHVKLRLPTPMQPNPWRRGRRDAAVEVQKVSGRVLLLALKCADRSRLRELLAGDEQLARLLPQGVPMAEPKVATKLSYDMIQFRGPIELPGPRGRVRKDRLLNVEGKPHAGGIDIDLDAHVMTVPWGMIIKADRAKPEA
jgi:hypothetical protein